MAENRFSTAQNNQTGYRSGEISFRNGYNLNVVNLHPPFNGSERSVPAHSQSSYAFWKVTGRTNRAESQSSFSPDNGESDLTRSGSHVNCKENVRHTPKDALVVSGNKFAPDNEYCITNGVREMTFCRTTSE
ncbi:uncharacterized protein LOC123562933 [Mercenaria mercenaria]|uniref:uncharacterized protein LOC123562933 n=1 Tax=Mercenaria mercenaria TaxID=6596 RepID=UPI00234F6B9A|nr:uncharacterized protein LOC123562933 [Mercenaria mercenaria]